MIVSQKVKCLDFIEAAGRYLPSFHDLGDFVGFQVGHERESPLLVLTYDFQTLERGSRAEIPHYQAFSQGFYWLALQFLFMFRCFFGSLLSAPNGATWLEGSNRKCRAVHLG